MVEKCVNGILLCFGSLLKKVRGMIVKNRISTKAKTFLLTLFDKRLPGYVITNGTEYS